MLAQSKPHWVSRTSEKDISLCTFDKWGNRSQRRRESFRYKQLLSSKGEASYLPTRPEAFHWPITTHFVFFAFQGTMSMILICTVLEFFLAVLSAVVWWKQSYSDFPGVSVMAGLCVLLVYLHFWAVWSYVSKSGRGRRDNQWLVMRGTKQVVSWWWKTVRRGKHMARG